MVYFQKKKQIIDIRIALEFSNQIMLDMKTRVLWNICFSLLREFCEVCLCHLVKENFLKDIEIIWHPIWFDEVKNTNKKRANSPGRGWRWGRPQRGGWGGGSSGIWPAPYCAACQVDFWRIVLYDVGINHERAGLFDCIITIARVRAVTNFRSLYSYNLVLTLTLISQRACQSE